MVVNIFKLGFLLGLLVSCQSQKVKSEELSKKAFELYFVNCKAQRTICADSALTLYKKAVALNNENFSAYENMIPILAEKKDLNGMIEVTHNLIRLRPNASNLKVQKALYLDVKGEREASRTLTKKAIHEYELQLADDPVDFNLNMEYINALIVNDQLDKAQTQLDLMRQTNYLDFQNELLKDYKIERDTKVKLKTYFNSNSGMSGLIK